MSGGTTAFQTEFINKNKKGIIDASELSRLTDLIEDAKNKGADVFQAGKASSSRSDHFDFRYTIISNAAFTMKIFREEIFGPLVAVEAIADIETAVEEMNNNFQSLGASIWSSNRKYAMNLTPKKRNPKWSSENLLHKSEADKLFAKQQGKHFPGENLCE